MPIRRIVADRAAVKNDIVADDTIAADGQGKPGIGVQRGIVLDLRPLAELDPFIVAAQNRAEPDTGLSLKPHTADQHRGIGDVKSALAGKFGRLSVEFVNRHSALQSEAANLPEQRRSREAS